MNTHIQSTTVVLDNQGSCRALNIVNSEEFGARSDGATPISNKRATSDDVPNFSSIDYTTQSS
ncbi:MULTISPECIES: palindromic element RPE2 domain-containing protein [unclassified Candidatus Tisiphia]|uniref:palindromic element RPE2 domain-containing protein n=1 Tax=unclassified Candidatus Tisiphia TaxID=2996318 RepID=UPI003CCAF826